MSRPHALLWDNNVGNLPNQGDMSVATLKSDVLSWNCCPGSLTLQFTGTPVGTITIFASDDHEPGKTDANATPVGSKWNGKWTSINALIAPPLTQPAGAAGDMYIDLPIRPAFIYVQYDRTSGSGTLKGNSAQANHQ
jgi:hypothetical protein